MNPTHGTAQHRHSGRERGATLVEFVIVSPIAVIVVLSVIQLGLLFSAKHIVNEATFVAARAGAVQNAQVDPMRHALINALIPFYQDSLDTTPVTRIGKAWLAAQADLLPLPAPLGNLDLTVLNPNSDVFSDFGLTDSYSCSGHTCIPNDSLEYRDYSKRGQKTGLTIQDANALKIRVTYGYKLKVPLMQSLFSGVMCQFPGVASLSDCLQYYNRGRVPIVSYAVVQMQTPAWQ